MTRPHEIEWDETMLRQVRPGTLPTKEAAA
jgi:hypothetical protein